VLAQEAPDVLGEGLLLGGEGEVHLGAASIEYRAMTVRRGTLALGVSLVGLAILFAVPGNGVLETNQHQQLGTVLSHLAVFTVVWSLLPSLRRLVPRLDTISNRLLAGVLTACVVAPVAVGVALGAAAPHATHQIITREWGIVEPLQAGLYATALVLCRTIREELAPRDPARDVFGAAAIVMGVFLLEEIDYLGLLTVLVRALGAPDGRLGRKHIGGFHDVLDAGTQMWGLVVIAAAVAVVLVAIWLLLGRYRATVVREVASRSALLLAIYAATFILAETIDFDDQLVAGLPGVKILEEPMELAAILCLNAALVLRLQTARRAARLSSLASGPPGSGAARR
jgi:hypothetical protein